MPSAKKEADPKAGPERKDSPTTQEGASLRVAVYLDDSGRETPCPFATHLELLLLTTFASQRAAASALGVSERKLGSWLRGEHLPDEQGMVALEAFIGNGRSSRLKRDVLRSEFQLSKHYRRNARTQRRRA
jgi:hypothetical protein